MLKALTLASLLLCLLAAPAAAQLDNQIAELNRKALDAYQSLDIESARNKLERAIKLAQRGNHVGPTVAQSFLALGLVYVAGMNDQEQGLAAFVNAICIQRDVQLDPLLSTPAVKQVFAQAQNDARAGACGPDAGPPPAAPAAPPPKQQPDIDLTVPANSVPATTETTDPALDSDTEPECPPGMRCHGRAGADDDSRSTSGFARFFASVQLSGGFSLLSSGMKADSKPTDLFSMPPRTSDVYEVKREFNMVTNKDEDHYYFRTESPWVPDADSFDDLIRAPRARGQTPLSENCKGDGIESGPTGAENASGVVDSRGLAYTTLWPSSFCVRVAKPGFVPALAMRANIGYFVTDNIAVSIPFRFQFQAGTGTFSHVLLGLRGEIMFARMTGPTGTGVSWFLGATYGQIQARPAPPQASAVEGPYAISGPFGVHTGVNLRIRVHRNFGFIISPEFDLQLPDILPHIDLSGGVETAF